MGEVKPQGDPRVVTLRFSTLQSFVWPLDVEILVEMIRERTS